MTDYMAAMLDELMGSARNANAGEKVELDFTSSEVCKDFIVAFCPHDLFRNTKNDMGYCSLKHDANLKKQYDESPRRFRLGYEERFLARVSELDRDVRRKIDKNEKRLLITQSAGGEDETFQKLKEKQEEKKEELIKKIDEKMEEAEKAGSDGNVTLAQNLVLEADKLREEKEQCEEEGQKLLTRFHHLEDVANSLNKPMKVCQTCGCFMLVNDAQSRIDDHFAGKLHIAYSTIRDILTTLPAEMKKAERPSTPIGGGSSSLGSGDSRRVGSSSDRHDKDQRDKDRDRRSSRDHRGDRDRSDRDRERRRSRSRDRRDHRDSRGGDRRDRDRDRRR